MNDVRALAYLAVGSNIRPEKSVRAALELLERNPSITLTGISTFYRTQALPDPDPGPDPETGTRLPPPGTGRPRPATGGAGRREDPDFLNGVLEIRTTLSVAELQEVLLDVERRLGRVRGADRYAPRTMDMDLLLYAQGSGRGGSLSWLPVRAGGERAHSDLRSRSFVALPLMELAPDLRLPPDGASLKAVADGLPGPCGRPAARFTETLRSLFLRV